MKKWMEKLKHEKKICARCRKPYNDITYYPICPKCAYDLKYQPNRYLQTRIKEYA